MKMPLTILAILAAVCACSVKENRTECPCHLTLSWGDDDSFAGGIILSLQGGDGFSARETLSPSDYPEGYELSVPREMLSVSAIRGKRSMQLDRQTMRVPDGEQADSIYAHGTVLDCRKESVRETLASFKQFATIRISLKGFTQPEHIALSVESNWNGFDIFDLSAVQGPFSAFADGTPYDTFAIRVPRQGDDNMTLAMFDCDATGTPSEKLKTFPLGKYLSDSGFDWYGKNLGDAEITVDYFDSEVTVRVEDWKNGGSRTFHF